MTSHRWELLSSFIVRGTGLPFGWLERLAFVDTSAAMDRVLEAEHELEGLGARVEAELRLGGDPSMASFRRKARKSVAAGEEICAEAVAKPPGEIAVALQRFNAAVRARNALRARARSVFQAELVEKRKALRGIAADAWFQEAVWLSSPQMYEHGLRPYVDRFDVTDRSREVRRIERQLVAYVQRFCAKNETASFFGPVNYGDFGPACGPGPAGPGPENLQERRAFIAHWAVQALAEAIACDPTIHPYLKPHRIPICVLDEERGKLRVGAAAVLDLPPTHREVYLLIDGSRRVGEIANVLRLATEQVISHLELLAKINAVSLCPRVPVSDSRPLERLLEFARDLPASCEGRQRWVKELETVVALRDRFARATLEQRKHVLVELEALWSRLVGREARRGGGAFYADRLIIYEECLGGVSPLALGPRVADELRAQLAPVLDVLASHACHVARQCRSLGRELLTRWSPDSRMSFLQFVARVEKENVTFEPAASPWYEAMRAQLAARSHEKVVAIDPDTLPPIDRSELAANVLIGSPDVMLAAADVEAIRDGRFHLVISECHDTFMVWGWALELCRRRDRIREEAARLLRRATRGRQVANVLASRRVKILPLEYPGATIELLARSERPDTERIAAVELEAHATVDGIALRAPGRPEVRLHNGELHTLAHALFSVPKMGMPSLTVGRHTPRLVLGEAILQRERWDVSRSDLFAAAYRGSSFELMYDFRKAMKRVGLPRWTFAKLPGHLKPILVDGENYFLLELLNSFLSEETQLTLSEMLPGPEDLWVRGTEERFCSEIRLSACYVAADAEAAGALGPGASA